MNIVAYTSSLNGKAALKACIESLKAQTYPIREIIVVDNRSTDGSSEETYPPEVTLICHLRNLGTSGAVGTAFEYAERKGYDWIWVLDQDTIPKSDALEKMVELYRGFDEEERSKIGVISSEVVLKPSDIVVHGRQLTPGGVRPTYVKPGQVYYECDATIWSGSLYNMEAVKKVGPPRFGERGCWEDLSLDYGDLEYSYRVKTAGYKVLGHTQSLIFHPVGKTKYFQFFSLKIYSTNHSAFRRYLYFRNMVYFWLYLYPNKKILTTLFFMTFRLVANLGKIFLMEGGRFNKLAASLVGVWDGLNKNLSNRYFYKPSPKKS